jgi:ribosomal protein S18 acetylase RimI-like enzyme
MTAPNVQQRTIRDATEDDASLCLQLDLSYETDYVWQMDMRDDSGALVVSFRTVRLPRPMRVLYPRDAAMLALAFEKRDCFLVVETAGVVRGYLTMHIDAASGNAWVTDLAVGRAWRRRQLASALLQEAYLRARELKAARFIVETQTKNFPAILFCQKHGLTFCGFNDHYYPNHDIALFFGQAVR